MQGGDYRSTAVSSSPVQKPCGITPAGAPAGVQGLSWTPCLGRSAACAIKKSCEATFDAQTGWSELFRTTPSAPIKGCLRRYFLEVASPPPLEQGNSSA